MNIDKAFKKWWAGIYGGDYDGEWIEILGRPGNMGLEEISPKNSYTAGAEYGYKEGRVDTLDEISVVIISDPQALEYIDTELKKIGE